jgi:WD40 repeat protein
VLHGHTLGVDDVAYSPEGALIASASLDDTARVWDPSNGRLLRIWRDPDLVTSVAFSSDGREIVTADTAGTIRVWDARTACSNARELLAIARAGSLGS